MPGEETQLNDRDLSTYKVAELKKELEKRGLPKSGNKSDLIKRLSQSIRSENLFETPENRRPESDDKSFDDSHTADDDSTLNTLDTRTINVEEPIQDERVVIHSNEPEEDANSPENTSKGGEVDEEMPDDQRTVEEVHREHDSPASHGRRSRSRSRSSSEHREQSPSSSRERSPSSENENEQEDAHGSSPVVNGESPTEGVRSFRSRSRSRSKSSGRSRSASRSPDAPEADKSNIADRSRDSSPERNDEEEVEESAEKVMKSSGKAGDGEKEDKQDDDKKPAEGNREMLELECSKEEGEVTDHSEKSETQATEEQKKERTRRWGKTAVKASKRSVNVTSESLKNLLPDATSLNESIGSGVKSLRHEEVGDSEMLDYGEDDLPGNAEADAAAGAPIRRKIKPPSPETAKEPAQRRHAIPIVELEVDEPEIVRNRISPPRNPPSRIIHVRELVRPFTLPQLKTLLKKFGDLVDESFWIDSVKSHCLAEYVHESDAVSARKALHGTKWPQSNPKVLRVDFGNRELLERLSAAEPVRGTAPSLKPSPPVGVQTGRETPEFPQRMERRRYPREPVGPSKSPLRDRAARAGHSRSRSRERARERRDSDRRGGPPQRRDRRPEERAKDKQPDVEIVTENEEPPVKLLDDLFKKTDVTPSIYWLPLTEEQSVVRAKKRTERLAELEKRRKERETAEALLAAKRPRLPSPRRDRGPPDYRMRLPPREDFRNRRDYRDRPRR